MIQCITLMKKREETLLKEQEEEDTSKSLLRELEDENQQCERVVLSEDNRHFDSGAKIREAVLREAYNLNLLIKYYPDLYDYKPSSIFSTIINKYQRKSVSKYTLDVIRKAFEDPEYDIYKTHVYDSKRRKLRTEQEILEQAPGEKYINDTQVFDVLRFMDLNPDNPKVKTWKENMFRQMQKEIIREKKEVEDEEKITIPRPDWLEPETEEERPDWVPKGIEGRMSLTAESAKKLSDAWLDIAIRIYQFPPQKQEDDAFYSRGIETMRALLVPGTDLKYVRDTMSYLDITYEMKTQSIHSAMSKSKILTPSGKYRKVTREQIADIAPQMILLCIHILEDLPGYNAFCLYLIREQKPFTGEFHDSRHEKLSESAFGKSSLMP